MGPGGAQGGAERQVHARAVGQRRGDQPGLGLIVEAGAAGHGVVLPTGHAAPPGPAALGEEVDPALQHQIGVVLGQVEPLAHRGHGVALVLSASGAVELHLVDVADEELHGGVEHAHHGHEAAPPVGDGHAGEVGVAAVAHDHLVAGAVLQGAVQGLLRHGVGVGLAGVCGHELHVLQADQAALHGGGDLRDGDRLGLLVDQGGLLHDVVVHVHAVQLQHALVGAEHGALQHDADAVALVEAAGSDEAQDDAGRVVLHVHVAVEVAALLIGGDHRVHGAVTHELAGHAGGLQGAELGHGEHLPFGEGAHGRRVVLLLAGRGQRHERAGGQEKAEGLHVLIRS